VKHNSSFIFKEIFCSMMIISRNKIKGMVRNCLDVVLIASLLCAQSFLSDFVRHQDVPGITAQIAQADNSDPWYDSDYLYRRSVIIDHTKVSNTDQENFPVLVSLKEDFLKNVSYGGNIRSANGYDIVFTREDGVSKLDHEIEKYNALTGELKAWVKVPILSASNDTALYMYYGNAGISVSQENISGVWNDGGSDNFKGVWHMKEDPSGTAPQMTDSTINGNSAASAGSMTSSNAIVGKVDGALSFDGIDDYIYKTDNPSLDFTTQLTLGMWVNSRFQTTDVFGLVGKTCGGGGAQDHHYMLRTNGPMLEFYIGNGDCATEVGSTDTLSKTNFFTGYENKWTYISATYNNGQMKLYRNGVLQTSKTSAITSLKNYSSNFEIGRYPDYPGFYINGSIDEVRVSNIARSADWIATEYNNMAWPNDFFSLGMEEMKNPLTLASWGYRKAITIDHNQVAGDLVNFPVLVNLPLDYDLASHAQMDADDILFTASDIAWTQGTVNDRLAHEIERFDSTTGRLQAWVKIPVLSASTDTVIYMYYGNSDASNQQNRTSVWDAHAMMVQHMGGDPGGEGPQLIDSTSHGNNGTAAGAMTSNNAVSGKWGNAIYFDGTDDLFSVPSSPSLSVRNEITMEAWMKSNDAWNGRSVFGKNYAYALYCHYPNMLKGYTYASTWYSSTSLQGLYNTRNWYHFVMSYRPTDGLIKVYLNGQEVAYSSQSAVSSLIAANGNPLYIGQAISSNTFYGTLEEVRLSDVARSPEWIETEYNNSINFEEFYDLGGEEIFTPAALSLWPYRKALTIDHNQVSGDQAGFPVLINLSADAGLRDYAQTDGDDIMFVSADIAWNRGTENDRFAHEIESYDPGTGSLQAWVKVPKLSSSADTVIYMYYGNPDAASKEKRYDTWSEGGGNDFETVQHMNNDPGGAAPQMKDSTAYGKDGTASGGMAAKDLVSGQIGAGLRMDAVDDYIDLGHFSAFNSLPLTLEAWVKTSGSGTSRGIITKYLANSKNGYNLYINNGRIKAWYFYDASNYTRQDADADDGGLINDGLWHHVVYRVDVNGGSIFVDGQLKNVKAWAGTAIAPTTTQPLRIGQYSFYFNGDVDEVRVSSRARTNGWITTEYNNQANPSAFVLISDQESYMDHFSITGNTSQVAGTAQEITLTAKSIFGEDNIHYTGEKAVVFTGASAIGGYVPTFTDKNGNAINFGSSGLINFTGGIAHTTIRLYGAEMAEIEVSDGTYSSADDPAYDLDVRVSGNELVNFSIDCPANITSESSFTLGLTAVDAYGNVTQTVDNPTSLSVSSGVIDTNSLASANFQDDGVYLGTITISEIYNDKDIILTISNGAISQTVNLRVTGVSHGVFLPPVKPDISRVKISFSDEGYISVDNLPNNIVQMAVSATPDFLNAIWHDVGRIDDIMQDIHGMPIIYVKFRTARGAVSDIIVCNQNVSSDSVHLEEGDIVKTASSFDVYVIKYQNHKQYKRLILSPSVFSSYQHLKWENIKIVTQQQLDSYRTSNLVQVKGDGIIYQLSPSGDTGTRAILDPASSYDPDSVYEINSADRDSYRLLP
jgi:hypothetical protein